MGYTVAVAGATGAVGKEMLDILAERKFPADDVIPLASERSAGDFIDFAGDGLEVRNLAEFDFKGVDIGLFSPGGAVSAIHAPRAGEAGCVVIDNTSHFRMDPDVPLVVPEVNPDAIAGYTSRNIIANPNCSTIQMVFALKPLHDMQPIKRVNVATDPFGVWRRVGGAHQVHQANRVQCDPPHRQFHGRRLHQGRVEDARRDAENPRSRDRRLRHLCARAGLHRPWRGLPYRVRWSD
jgi:hypothetical protein